MGILFVYIEYIGQFKKVGELVKNEKGEVTFSYCNTYLEDRQAVPISIGLPLEEESFDPLRTSIFFEGLLPEGFLRRTIASDIRVEENDYFSILRELGQECLGAILILGSETDVPKAHYEEIDEKVICELAREGATESASVVLKTHLSLTGASGKVGLYYDGYLGKWYLPYGTAPSTHIVKQSHVRLHSIVVNEQLSLLTARNLGIDVPESFILSAGGNEDGDILFATKRYDRMLEGDRLKIPHTTSIDGLRIPYRLHQEDFSQALGIPAKDKYEKKGNTYLKRAFELVRNYSSDPIEDMYKLWDYLIFDYLIGNTDNHVKNFSLLYSPDLHSIRLAPLYDTICTTIYESSTRDMAMAVAGKYRIDEIDRGTFQSAADELKLGRKMAMEHFDELSNRFVSALTEAADELADNGFRIAPEIRNKILESRRIQ